MRLGWRGWLIALCAVMFARSVCGQETVTLEYLNENLQPSHWVLTIHSDGSGKYDSFPGEGAGTDGNRIREVEVHRRLHLSQKFVERVFATAHQRNLFHYQCESRLKVAFQGEKRLSYDGPDGSGSCSYNYSKDNQIQALGESLLAVESTIEFGERLEVLEQHDRLGMDREMAALYEASQSGSALEVGAIQETLERIVADEQVLERVRRKARLLLAGLH